MSNNKEIYYKSVYFDLPYLIFVKDGFKDKVLEDWAKAYSKGEKDLPYSPYAPNSSKGSYMTIGGGFPVYMPPDELSPTYIISLGSNIAVGVQFLRRINQSSRLNMCGEMPGDRTGRASFSSVRVNFDLKIFKPEYHWDMAFFCNLSIDAVNKFIEHYRVIAERFYVKPVTPQVIQTFTIFNSFTDTTTSTQTFITGSGAMHGLGGAIEEGKDKKLREVLLTEESAPIVETLHLEVQDKLDLREWRLAIIESAVLFETWVNIFLRNCYRNSGLTDADIEDKFIKNDKYRTPLSAYAIANKLVLDSTGFDFGKTSEFSKWSKHTKDVRNDIVHGKKHVTSEDDARKAYSAAIDAINLITTNSNKKT